MTPNLDNARFPALCFLALAIFSPFDLAAQERPRIRPLPPAGLNLKTGPELGSRVPHFSLPDQNGRARDLANLRGPNGLVLAFVRSADWWPYCKAQLVELDSKLDDFRARGLGVAALTYDSSAVLKHFATRANLRLPLLSDSGSSTIRAFGILNENIEKGTPFFGVPFPGTYILDHSGKVTAKFFEDDYRERVTAASILVRRFNAAGVSGTSIQTPHLKLTASSSNAEVYGGSRISLILDIELPKGIHVYAPGVTGGYIPVTFTVPDRKPAWLALPWDPPPARTLHLKAIRESLPVYERKFRLTRDIVIGQERELASALSQDRTLTINTEFRYQACDDRVCYPPRSLPITHSFKVRRHDSLRAPVQLRGPGAVQ